jgi:hypothetical protein
MNDRDGSNAIGVRAPRVTEGSPKPVPAPGDAPLPAGSRASNASNAIEGNRFALPVSPEGLQLDRHRTSVNSPTMPIRRQDRGWPGAWISLRTSEGVAK